MNEIICGNSLEIMKQYKDKEFDLCLTDPPYNLGVDYGLLVNDNKTYDEYKKFSIKWFTEAKRVSNSVIFSCGVTNLKMWLTDIEYPKALLCWYSSNTQDSRNLTGGGFIHWEPMLLYGKVAIAKDAFNHKCKIQRNKGSHLTPKPRALYVDILKSCYWMKDKKKQTPKKVIDPFVGSGTTAMACKVLGIDCVGIDIDPDYIREAKRNINASQYGGISRWCGSESFRLYKKEASLE